MRIEILETTGVRCEEYGHMKYGEIREVDEDFGRFCCANGWARDVAGEVETGERGKLDRQDWHKWCEQNPPARSAREATE